MSHEAHEARVRRVAEEIRARAAGRSGGDGHISIGKAAVSHFVPNPHDPRHRDRKVDMRDLREVLDLDVAERTCTAEPGLTFDELVRATLRWGLAPACVPELRTITIGGAVSGCSIESMSFRHGGFHDGCLEYEVVTGTGEVVRCSREQDPELFEMIHGSYGTLGYLTRLTFRLVPAKPFVAVEHRLHETFEAFEADLRERVRAGDADFVDGIIGGPRAFVLCLGRFADDAPGVRERSWLEPYWKIALRGRDETFTTRDYFFRYDSDCHWLTTTVPGLGAKPVRFALGRFFLGSTNLIRWSDRLRPILKLRKRPPVVVDLFFPSRRFAEFYRWYEREVGFFPVWIVPYRLDAPYPWIDPEYAREMRDTLFIDFAVYGAPNRRNGADLSEVLERKTHEMNGIKTLISRNHYDETTFWKIYDRARYERVKQRTDPQDLFRDLYRKMNFGG